MRLKEQIKEKRSLVNNWLYDHLWVKNSLDWLLIFIVSTISALIFAFGFNTFLDPGSTNTVTEITCSSGNVCHVPTDKIVSGGVSGVSQVLVLFFRLCGWDIKDEHLAYSILYFVINIPLIFLAWFGIGKRFAIFTLINVGEVSLFIKIITISYIPGLANIAAFVNTEGGGLLARALFAGICTGLSSALAYRVDISAGGIDVLAYYIALRKNTLVGKYSVILNSITLICFTLLTCALASWDSATASDSFARVFYSIIYMFIGMLLVDNINVRNKKVKVEIITTRKDLGSVLIDNIPHGATLVKGEGVFTGEAKYIITIVVSYYEVDDVVNLVKKEDDHAFVQVIPLRQVYGRFFVKPVK